MSLIPRNVFKELRKAFQALEQPFLHHNKSIPAPLKYNPQNDLLKAFGLDNLDVLTGFSGASVTEAGDGKNYIVEAELPGVKKENLKVEFTDNGEVLHIEGVKGALPSSASATSSGGDGSSTAAAGDAPPESTSTDQAVEKANESTSIVPDWAKESFSYGTFHETFVSTVLPPSITYIRKLIS